MSAHSTMYMQQRGQTFHLHTILFFIMWLNQSIFITIDNERNMQSSHRFKSFWHFNHQFTNVMQYRSILCLQTTLTCIEAHNNQRF